MPSQCSIDMQPRGAHGPLPRPSVCRSGLIRERLIASEPRVSDQCRSRQILSPMFAPVVTCGVMKFLILLGRLRIVSMYTCLVCGAANRWLEHVDVL